jgi:hypothetical protein
MARTDLPDQAASRHSETKNSEFRFWSRGAYTSHKPVNSSLHTTTS